MALAGQRIAHRLRGRDAVPAVHRHPVTAFRETPDDRGPDTPRPTCNKNRTTHDATLPVGPVDWHRRPAGPSDQLPHRSRSLVIVAQFRAVPVAPVFRSVT
jgi:hypothetical protein